MSAGSTSVAPCFFNRRSHCVHERVDRLAEAERLARDADPRAAQPGRIEELRVVGLRFAGAGRGRRIVGIDAGERAQQDRGVAHRARHRAGRVLAVGDGNDAGAAHRPDRRLDADDAVDDDGHTIEPSVSVPIAAAHRFAATAAPEPELEPQGLRSSA